MKFCFFYDKVHFLSACSAQMAINNSKLEAIAGRPCLFVTNAGILSSTGERSFASKPPSLVPRFLLRNPNPKRDGLDKNDMLVFANNNKIYLLPSYVALLVTSICTTINLAYLVTGYFDGTVSAAINPDHPLIYATLGTAFGIALLVATRALLRRTFIRIYYNEAKGRFVGITYSWLMSKQQVNFNVDDVKTIVNTAASQELTGNFTIAGKPYYLPLKDFKSPLYYNLMTGQIKVPQDLD